MNIHLPFSNRGLKSIAALFLLISISVISFAGTAPLPAAPANKYVSSTAIGTTTTLSSSANPVCFGVSLTLTATLNTLAATGTVEFFDGATSLGTSPVSNITGAATLSLSTLTAGSHSLSAVYSGDFLYTTSTGNLTQVINTIPATPGAISGTSPVCPSTNGLVYSIAAVPGATSYTWTSPGTGWSLQWVPVNTTSITYNTGKCDQWKYPRRRRKRLRFEWGKPDHKYNAG